MDSGQQWTDYTLKAYKQSNDHHRVAAIGGKTAEGHTGEEIGELKTSPTGEANWMWVTPKFRRQGVATAMWKHMQSLAEKGHVPHPVHSDPELQSEAAQEFSKKVK